MTFLSFSFTFGLLAVLHGYWIHILNFVPFVVNALIKGEIEKPSDQYLGLICDE
jgi:nitrate reductase gamma subunit